ADAGRPDHRAERPAAGGHGGHRRTRRPRRIDGVPAGPGGRGAGRPHRHRRGRPVHRGAAPMIGELGVLLGAGLPFMAAVGVVPAPDTLARMHALTKGSSLGLLLMLLGAVLNIDNLTDGTSVLLATVLHLLTSPPASNMMSRATYLAGATGGSVL